MHTVYIVEEKKLYPEDCDEMSKDDEVLETIKELAKSKGNRIPMPAIYRSIVQKGTYTSDKHIRNALKRLEMRGKIKTGGMNQLELLIERDGN